MTTRCSALHRVCALDESTQRLKQASDTHNRLKYLRLVGFVLKKDAGGAAHLGSCSAAVPRELTQVGTTWAI